MRLICFDFDKTLIHTMEPEEGRQIWLREKGENFPHPTGWWSKPETLDLEVFYPTVNQWTIKRYAEAISDSDNYVFIATGRMEKLKPLVEKILISEHVIEQTKKYLGEKSKGIIVDDVFCNWGSETYKFKTRLFEGIIRKNPKATEFILYDDRHEHLVKFVEWAAIIESQYSIKVSIIDVLNTKQLH